MRTPRPSIAWSLLATAAIASAVVPPALAAACRDRTPAGASIRLAPEGEPGQRLVIEGRVLDAAGRPIAGATVFAYQADANGIYALPGPGLRANADARLCGVLRTDEGGQYRIATVRPSTVRNLEGGAPHVHFEVWTAQRSPIFALLTFRELRGVAKREAAFKAGEGVRTASERPIALDPDGVWRCVRDFRLR